MVNYNHIMKSILSFPTWKY